MNYKKEIAKLLVRHVRLKEAEVESLLEVPPQSEMGDFAFPCFSLAKQLKKNPIHIAEEIAEKLSPSYPIERAEYLGPYINFFVDKMAMAENVLEETFQKNLGIKTQNSLTRMVEFSQANTHKAFHVGHIRGTSIGESLARIAEFFGEKVIRANYQGDTGMHVAKWLWCYQKYHAKEKLMEDESWVAGIYVDAVKRLAENEKLQEEVDEINRKLDEGSDKKLNELWQKTRKLSLNSLEVIYKELNTRFDKYYFESEVEKEAKGIAQELVKKGIAKISDEATIMDLEKYNLGVWVLLRRDGTVLYSAKDIVLAKRKFAENKLDKSIYVVADEQNLHIKQLIKTLELMNFKDAKKISHVSYGMVRLPEGKMSSRTGENILYSNFKKEATETSKKAILEKWPEISKKELESRALKIAVAAMKYSMLSQDFNKIIIFDKEQEVKFEGETGPYLQYSYARASSILKKAGYKSASKIMLPSKIQPAEAKLISKISKFQETVQAAYEKLAPNLIAHYSFELAQIFNEFYHDNKVIGSEEEPFRLKLVDAFRTTLKTSLYLLGIDVLEEM